MGKKIGFSPLVFFLAILGLIGFSASTAKAVKEFKDAFQAKYIKTDSPKPNDIALAHAFDQAGCAVCHAGGNNKRIRNDYGKQLAKLVSKEDKRDKAKIEAALDAVAKLKSKPADPTSPTFGEKIASGKLPAMGANALQADDFGPPQDGGGPGGPGGFGGPGGAASGGGGLGSVKSQLRASDEEWKIIEPLLRKVISARQAVETGMNAGETGDFGGRRGGFGGFGGQPGRSPGGPGGPGGGPGGGHLRPR